MNTIKSMIHGNMDDKKDGKEVAKQSYNIIIPQGTLHT
jgi:hypothetical protein